jgi:hypothetical protein
MLMERLRFREPDASVLDEAHMAVWDAVRHLFPADAAVTQTDYGRLVVSWPIEGLTCTHFAAPVLMRIEPGLLLALWTCEPDERELITMAFEPIVRTHLAGYDPHSRIPTCGVIVLGNEEE